MRLVGAAGWLVASLPRPSAGSSPAAAFPARQKELIESFVRQMANPARSGQHARSEGALCTGVVGLAAEQALWLNGRIGEAAGGAGPLS